MQPDARAQGADEYYVRDPDDPLTFFKAWRTVCLAIMYSCFGLKVRGRPNFPRRGGVVVASNHASFVDPVAVGVAAPRPMAFLARHSLYRSPAFGKFIWRLNAYPLPRESTSTEALRRALKLLRGGWPLLVFPEGTRTPDGKLQPFRGGLALLASKGRVPVIPVAVRGSYECWPRSRRFPRPGKITVAFGPLILYDEKSDTYDSFTERVAGAVAALVQGAPAAPGMSPGVAQS